MRKLARLNTCLGSKIQPRYSRVHITRYPNPTGRGIQRIPRNTSMVDRCKNSVGGDRMPLPFKNSTIGPLSDQLEELILGNRVIVPGQLFVDGLLLFFSDADRLRLLLRESITSGRCWIQERRGRREIHDQPAQWLKATAWTSEKVPFEI